jgi:hypothetical protein
MKKCIICDQPTTRPVLEALWHFRLVDWNQWQFWRGNINTFGLASGMRSNLCLSFPILNTLLNWKYRKARLVFPKDWTP